MADPPNNNIIPNPTPTPTPTIQLPDQKLVVHPTVKPPEPDQSQLSTSSSTPLPTLPLPLTLPNQSVHVPVPSPRPVLSPSGTRRHPTFRGIRIRSGKWVSEIREPRKTTRIWLGTYPTPEMAAAAYDVAALGLKGPDTPLNFPNSIFAYPIPASTSAADIRAAAASAAAARVPKQEETGGTLEPTKKGKVVGPSTAAAIMGAGQEFIDEEAMLNPNFFHDMAEGMMVTPPRSPPADDSPGNSDGESLWSYT
ncbi:hypothetical protein ACFE04_028754 [Oxalis oulophora]